MISRAVFTSTEREFEILIVDDDMGLALNLKGILEEKGYPVAVAHDGQAAHALFREKIFDLALVDLKLPDMS
ncbi:MAG: response regulator, partial [Pseudomonadota bacterium]